jgi:RNA polymerase sigma-70 factor (ECF subfamily)
VFRDETIGGVAASVFAKKLRGGGLAMPLHVVRTEMGGAMDFSEYVFMEGAVRDRLDDLQRAAGLDRDHDIVEALRRQEPTAAERLVAAWGSRAYRLAFGITRNRQDAEEAVQDAFLAAARRIDTFRGDSAFGSWLYRVLTNASYQKLRGRRAGPGETIGPEPAALDEPARRAELRMALTTAIDQLPADYRVALILHDVEGLSNPEIGAVLKISVPNVKSRVHRARSFLRRRLGDYATTLGSGGGRPREVSMRAQAACGA